MKRLQIKGLTLLKDFQHYRGGRMQSVYSRAGKQQRYDKVRREAVKWAQNRGVSGSGKISDVLSNKFGTKRDTHLERYSNPGRTSVSTKGDFGKILRIGAYLKEKGFKHTASPYPFHKYGEFTSRTGRTVIRHNPEGMIVEVNRSPNVSETSTGTRIRRKAAQIFRSKYANRLKPKSARQAKLMGD